VVVTKISKPQTMQFCFRFSTTTDIYGSEFDPTL